MAYNIYGLAMIEECFCRLCPSDAICEMPCAACRWEMAWSCVACERAVPLFVGRGEGADLPSVAKVVLQSYAPTVVLMLIYTLLTYVTSDCFGVLFIYLFICLLGGLQIQAERDKARTDLEQVFTHA